MGTPRKNNAIKSLEGHPNKRRFNTAPNTQGTPQRPYGLSTGSKRAWDKLVPQLVEMGTATEIDETALTALVNWWDLYQRSSKQLAKQTDLTSAESVKLLRTATSAYENFRRLAGEFGLTPKSRASLEIKETQEDDLARFIA